MVLDDSLTVEAFKNTDELLPWVICILENQNKDPCVQYAHTWIISENIAVATVFIMSFVGIEAFFLLCRWEIFSGWWKLGLSLFHRGKERTVNRTIIPSST